LKRCLQLALVVLLTGCSAEPTVGELRVCLGANDPPRSQASPLQGLDVDVAQLLARGLQRELQPVWLAGETRGETESSDLDFASLLRGRCDLQLSIPGAEALGQFAPHLALTRPYYGAGFELVPDAASLDLDSPGNERVAVRGNTVAHLYLDRLGFRWTMRRDSADIAAAIGSGEADAGLVWGPDLAGVGMTYNPAFEPPAALRWNHHGVTRKADVDLRDALDAVLARPDVADDIEASMRRHGLPPRRPFESVHQLEMLTGS